MPEHYEEKAADGFKALFKIEAKCFKSLQLSAKDTM